MYLSLITKRWTHLNPFDVRIMMFEFVRCSKNGFWTHFGLRVQIEKHKIIGLMVMWSNLYADLLRNWRLLSFLKRMVSKWTVGVVLINVSSFIKKVVQFKVPSAKKILKFSISCFVHHQKLQWFSPSNGHTLTFKSCNYKKLPKMQMLCAKQFHGIFSTNNWFSTVYNS